MFFTPTREQTAEEEKYDLLYKSPEKFFEKYPEEGNDREVIKVAATEFGHRALAFASAELLDDKEIIRLALTYDNNAFACASERLRDDVDFAREVITDDVTNLYYVSPRLQHDRKFLLEMMEIHPSGRARAFDFTPALSAEDCFCDELKEKIGSLSAQEYFRREEFFERLHASVPVKPSAKEAKRKL
jgi:hypothetical protein